MNFGILDIEMTCDGRQDGEKFIDDGRMKHFQREIISVGFIVFDDKYTKKRKYKSFVKPVHNKILTDYCKNLTKITQENVDNGKKCNEAFRDIVKICKYYSVRCILTFGGADKAGIFSSIRWCREAKEQIKNMYIIASKIIDIRPLIIKNINCNDSQKGLSLSKIANMLKIKNNLTKHNALNDALLLYKICKNIDLKTTVT